MRLYHLARGYQAEALARPWAPSTRMLGTADPAGPLGEQERDDIGDLLGRTKTAEREVPLDEPLEALGIPLAK